MRLRLTNDMYGIESATARVVIAQTNVWVKRMEENSGAPTARNRSRDAMGESFYVAPSALGSLDGLNPRPLA
jgi:hypothetical protein